MVSVRIRAMKADNSLHRCSEGKLDVLNKFGCAIWSQPGNMIFGPSGPVWETDCLVRTLFIRGARLNLLEIHEADHTPREVYLNVIAPAEISANEVIYIDHELDVRSVCGEAQGACILDAEEFEEATATYGYDDVAVTECWDAARLGKSIANAWEFGLSSEAALKFFATELGAMHD